MNLSRLAQLVVFLALAQGSTYAAVNDSFAAAFEISSVSGAVIGSSVGASREPAEPAHLGNTSAPTVWYQWIAPIDCSFTIDTDNQSTDFDTILVVYSGDSLENLTPVASNDDSVGIGRRSRLSFHAGAGSVYRIVVLGYWNREGNFGLTWSATPLFPPANDNFNNLVYLNGYTGSVTGTTVSATRESEELNHLGNSTSGTVWYAWSSPSNGTVTIDTDDHGTNFDTMLAVYTGNSVSDLALVVSDNDGATNLRSRVVFNATAETNYRIVVLGYGSLAGDFRLSWTMPPPGNDDLANAQALTGLTGTVTGTTRQATRETHEQEHFGNATAPTVWYKWTSSFDGFLTVNAGYGTIAVYTGSDPGGLTLVAAASDDAVTFRVSDGLEYRIVVLSAVWSTGDFTLTWRRSSPGNDNFEGAKVLSGVSGGVTGAILDATREAGEPNHLGNAISPTVWYQWTAPGSGTVTIDTNDAVTDFDTILVVYTGYPIGSLTSVAANDNGAGIGLKSRVTFSVTKNTNYFIAVLGSQNNTGDFRLSWRMAPPGNDAFASAQSLTGSAGTVAGTTIGATRESAELDHFGNVETPTVWYSWTSTFNGLFTIDTDDPATNFDTILAIYTGNSLGALTPVASNDNTDFFYPGRSSVTFRVSIGTVYRIAVLGGDSTHDPVEGEFRLSWRSVPPGNDRFSAREQLTGLSGTVAGTTELATRETGEPSHMGNAASPTVWYRWTPGAGTMTIDTGNAATNFDTILAVYAGSSLSGLTPIASNDNGAGIGLKSSVTFVANANTEYKIAVLGTQNNAGNFGLSWGVAPPPPPPPPSNDSFANAQTLAGASGSVIGATIGATREAGEPEHFGRPSAPSAWYAWTSPFDGFLTIDTLDAPYFYGSLAVYTGNTLGGLTLVSGGSYSGFSFGVNAGGVYHIAVFGDPGNFRLRWKRTPPANDNFYNATQLTGTSGFATSTTRYGSRETNEGAHLSNLTSSTVWYTWTAPGIGPVTFDTAHAATNFDTILAVYTGSSFAGLTPVASNDNGAGIGSNSRVTFTASKGTSYRIVVLGPLNSEGEFGLLWRMAAPDNDHFANAQPLAGPIGTMTGATFAATREPGEPDHEQNGISPTVWYTWTSSFDGFLEIYAGDADFDTMLAVYSGDALSGLTVVASNDNFTYYSTSRVNLRVHAGTDYHIVVLGAANKKGSFTLFWERVAPDNSNFVSAETITGPSGAATGATLDGNRESGEVLHLENANSPTVWYYWFSPANATVVFDTDSAATNFDTMLAVYTGNNVSTLELVASNNDGEGIGLKSRVTFKASRGTVYRIAVLGYEENAGDFGLSWTMSSPENDYFVNAAVLSGGSGTFAGTTVAATREPGEPDNADYANSPTVWYQWTASADAFTIFWTTPGAGSYYSPVNGLEVYSGNSIGSLQLDGESSGVSPTVRFNALAGVTYRIRVFGNTGFNLNWTANSYGALKFVTDAVFVPESVEAVMLTVVRTGSVHGPVSVNYRTDGPSGASSAKASAGSDFAPVSGTLTFADGEMSKTISIPIFDDATAEPDEQFTVSLSAPQKAEIAIPSKATVAILRQSELRFSSASYFVNESTGQVSLVVERRGDLGGMTTVGYESVAGTAGPADFTPVTGTLTFGPGESSKQIRVLIGSDLFNEDTEEFSVQLRNPIDGADLGLPTRAVISISDQNTQYFRGLGSGHFIRGERSFATGISGDGRVVVGSRVVGSYDTMAFRYDVTNNILEHLPDSQVVAASDDGDTILCPHSVWTRDGGIKPISDFDGYGISGDGLLVVGSTKFFTSPFNYVDVPGVAARTGTTWNAVLLAPAAESWKGRASAVAGPAGTVFVGTQESAFGNEAFRFEGGTATLLGHLPGGGSHYTSAAAVSANGEIVAGESISAGGREAYVWSADDGMRGLGDFSGATFESSATDISADGTLVVGYGTSGQGSEAFLWDTNRGLRSIQQLLVEAGMDMSGWKLTKATGISNDGNRIVGEGVNPDGFEEAWLAVIEVPPVVTNGGTAGFPVGTPFNWQIHASRNPVTYDAVGMPPGLTLDAQEGLITGTLNTRGYFDIVISAANTRGTGTAHLFLSVGAPLITSPLAATGAVELPFNYQVTGDVHPHSFEASGLPAGLTVDSITGMISGTPREAGTFDVQISAANSVGTGSASLRLTVGAPILGFNSPLYATGRVGTAFTYQVSVAQNPQSFGATGLPEGLTLNGSTGLISGTPVKSGLFEANITASNETVTGNFALKVAIAPLGSNPEADIFDALGHGLEIVAIAGQGDWDSGSFTGSVTIRNPASVSSIPGRLEVVGIGNSGNSGDLLQVRSVPALGADGTIRIDVTAAIGRGINAPVRADPYAILYEGPVGSEILQDSALLTHFINYDTGPPTGGASLPGVNIPAPGATTVTMAGVGILGPTTVPERTVAAGDFRAQALMSDGTTLNISVAAWTSSRFSIARQGSAGRLSTGEVAEDQYTNVSATVTVAGVTKTGTIQVLITNAGDTFAIWRSSYFTPLELANATLTGPAADFDGDGIDNLLEFALRLNPTLNDRTTMISGTGIRGLPVIRREIISGQPRLTAEYVRRRAASNPGITYSVQFSSSLTNPADWVAGGSEVFPTTVIDAVWERVRVVDQQPASPRRFGRVTVTGP